MSKYFEVLVFGHGLSQDSFSYRANRFADVGAIVIISCACLSVSTANETLPALIGKLSIILPFNMGLQERAR
jgi:hypothetical protein